ncbi:hypothetical protein FACS189475_07910 [Betaproteobacteria bacterium]|nr:hypothetical protein FACS189475_07910 [Betaproteobacteria bacterium]
MNTVNIIEKLQQLSSCIEIVHHVPGRIRLRLLDDLPSLNVNAESLISRAQALKDTLDDLPGIRSIRVNALARSCTIEYDHRNIPFQAWPDFLGCVQSDAAAVLRRIISAKYLEAACA